jgi:lysophospholipase L1-like esterase
MWMFSPLLPAAAMAGAAYPKIETLQDPFVGLDEWIDNGSVGDATISGGQLRLKPRDYYPSITSLGRYDLTESSIFVQYVSHPGSTGGTTDMLFIVETDGAQYFWSVGNNPVTAACGWNTGSGTSNTFLGSVSYTPGMYLRVRHAGTTVYFEYSLNGTSWTLAYSMTAQAVDHTAMRISLMAGDWGGGRTDVYCAFDNLNLVAEGSSAANGTAAQSFSLTQSATGKVPAITTGFVCDGDSLTNGTGTAPNYPAKLGALTSLPFINRGVNGQTLVSMDSGYATNTAPSYSTTYNTLVILGGTNDLSSSVAAATLGTAIRSYAAKAKATGFKVIVATVPPSTVITSAKETERTAYNTDLRNNWGSFADGIVDFAAISQFSDPTNTTYFRDGTHPTAAGYALMAEAVRVACTVASNPSSLNYDLINGLGAFSSTLSDNWYPVGGASWAIVSGELRITAGGSNVNGREEVYLAAGYGDPVAGKTYRIAAKLRVGTAASCRIDLVNGDTFAVVGSSGTVTASTATPVSFDVVWPSASNGLLQMITLAPAGGTFYVDDLTIREITVSIGTAAQSFTLSQAAQGDVDVQGSAAHTIPALSQSAAAAVRIAANAAHSLAVASSGTGTALARGTAAQSLAVASSAAGDADVRATGAQALTITQAAAGQVIPQGDGVAAQTIPAFSQAATGAVRIAGQGSQTFTLGQSAAAALRVAASAAQSIAVTQAASGAARVGGSASHQVAHTSAAAGDVDVSGQGSQSFVLGSLASGGTENVPPRTANASQSLGPLGQSASGSVRVSAQGAQTVPAISNAASAAVRINGAAAHSLTVSQAAQGRAPSTASADQVLSFGGSASGVVEIRAAAGQVLDLTSDGQAHVEISGHAQQLVEIASEMTGGRSTRTPVVSLHGHSPRAALKGEGGPDAFQGEHRGAHLGGQQRQTFIGRSGRGFLIGKRPLE